jgi:hypothetical protein
MVGGFAGPVHPSAPVGTFAGSPRRRNQGTGGFAGDPDTQRQGSFGDSNLDVATRDRGSAMRIEVDEDAPVGKVTRVA